MMLMIEEWYVMSMWSDHFGELHTNIIALWISGSLISYGGGGKSIFFIEFDQVYDQVIFDNSSSIYLE